MGCGKEYSKTSSAKQATYVSLRLTPIERERERKSRQPIRHHCRKLGFLQAEEYKWGVLCEIKGKCKEGRWFENVPQGRFSNFDTSKDAKTERFWVYFESCSKVGSDKSLAVSPGRQHKHFGQIRKVHMVKLSNYFWWQSVCGSNLKLWKVKETNLILRCWCVFDAIQERRVADRDPNVVDASSLTENLKVAVESQDFHANLFVLNQNNLFFQLCRSFLLISASISEHSVSEIVNNESLHEHDGRTDHRAELSVFPETSDMFQMYLISRIR